MNQPIIREDLVDAAAALLLCQHESPFVVGEAEGWATEANLADARTAASAYLVACFNHAATAIDDD